MRSYFIFGQLNQSATMPQNHDNGAAKLAMSAPSFAALIANSMLVIDQHLSPTADQTLTRSEISNRQPRMESQG
jgi:hypothetical protein